MILVDTSVWVDRLRRGNNELISLLGKVQVITHPFVIGELACDNLKHRRDILSFLEELPQASVAEHHGVMELIETKKILRQGIGWIDAHLLAASLISGAPLWTSDRRLRSLALMLEVLNWNGVG